MSSIFSQICCCCNGKAATVEDGSKSAEMETMNVINNDERPPSSGQLPQKDPTLIKHQPLLEEQSEDSDFTVDEPKVTEIGNDELKPQQDDVKP